jgi:hypothetical protein
LFSAKPYGSFYRVGESIGKNQYIRMYLRVTVVYVRVESDFQCLPIEKFNGVTFEAKATFAHLLEKSLAV